ncbi:MAG: oligosaccharide repeat unit polymerase [Fibrobacteraceae bacterium]|nr:oligosaccharide repeat unit polymerase [Fibrobacteraceae bacterium]
MLGVAYLKLNPAMTDFSLFTWMVWIGGLLSFLGGCFLMNLVWTSRNGSPMDFPLKLHCEYDWNRHFLFSFVAFGYFLIGVFCVISIVGNLILFTDSPGSWMGKSPKVGAYAVFFCSSPMVVSLFGVASFKSLNPSHRYIRWVSRFMAIFTTCLSFMTFPNRGTTFVCAGSLVVLYNYLHKKLSFSLILIIAGIGLAAFILIAAIKNQYGEGSVAGQIATSSVIDLPYKYVANNYWNLDYALNKDSDEPEHPTTFGADIFYGVLYYTHLPEALRTSFGWDTPYNESVEKVNGLNTVSYLWDAYKDFGLPGVFLEPFFFGLLFTFIYRRLSVMKTPMGVLFHTMFVFWILFWSFTTGYKQPMYWAWILFFLLIPALCSKKATSRCDLCGKNSSRELQ